MPQILHKHPPPPMTPMASSVYRALNDLAYDRKEGGGIPFSSRFMYIQFINASQPDQFLNLLNTGEEVLMKVSQKWQSLSEKNRKRSNDGRHKHNSATG